MVLDFYKPDGGSYGLEHRYLYGPAVDQVLAQENVMAAGLSDSGRVSWLLADNLGTVRDIVNNTGALTEHYKYDAYGNILSGNDTLSRYLYTGREFDATTGLQYNRNRWYDSKSGGWLSEDPIGFKGGDANLYRYVGNNPTNATDPTGTIVVVFNPPPKPSWWPDWAPDWDSLHDPKNFDPSDVMCPIAVAPKIGGSGLYKIYNIFFPSKKAAKEAAALAGKCAPIQHASPKVGWPHFHPTGPNGKKIPGTHYNYPP